MKVIEGEVSSNDLTYQIGLMKLLDSEFVIKCEDVYEHEGRYHIMLEKMERGRLSRIIENWPETFSIDFCKYAIYCVAIAIKEMHDRNIVHRDIRSCNILVNTIGDIKLKELSQAIFLTVEHPV